MVVDGSYGFDEPVDAELRAAKQPPTGPAAGVGGGLYSDNIVKTNSWGRGFSRNGGRFGGR
jgi:hypothetical protein